MDTLILNIAGFYIRIIFQPIIRPFYKKSLLTSIEKVMSPFIINKQECKRTDVDIAFVKTPSWEVVKELKNKGKSYYRFFYQQHNNSYKVSVYVGLYQFLFLLKRIIESLLNSKSGFVIHASSCIFKDNVLLFVGRQGAGKSTAVSFMKKSGATPLTDDNAIIIFDKRFYMYQTPFIETNYNIKKTNTRYQVRAVFFLKKAKFNKIEKVENKTDCVKLLSKQLLIRNQLSQKQTKLLLKFVEKHTFYYLYFEKKIKKFMAFINNASF